MTPPSDFDRAQRAYDAQEDPAYYDHEPDEDPEECEPDLPDDEDFEERDYERALSK